MLSSEASRIESIGDLAGTKNSFNLRPPGFEASSSPKPPGFEVTYHLGRLTEVMSWFEFAFEFFLIFFEIGFKLLFEYATICPKPSNYNIVWRACI